MSTTMSTPAHRSSLSAGRSQTKRARRRRRIAAARSIDATTSASTYPLSLAAGYPVRVSNNLI